MRASIFLFNLVFLFWSLPSMAFAAEPPEKQIAYKLAILHVRYLEGVQSFSSQNQTPSPAVISEFQWIMESLKNICLNPEQSIADTIMETWGSLRTQGYQVTILETARELLKVTKSAALKDKGKVNFRMTSQYWLTHTAETTFYTKKHK
jgi:hypothetical protein